MAIWTPQGKMDRQRLQFSEAGKGEHGSKLLEIPCSQVQMAFLE